MFKKPDFKKENRNEAKVRKMQLDCLCQKFIFKLTKFCIFVSNHEIEMEENYFQRLILPFTILALPGLWFQRMKKIIPKIGSFDTPLFFNLFVYYNRNMSSKFLQRNWQQPFDSFRIPNSHGYQKKIFLLNKKMEFDFIRTS